MPPYIRKYLHGSRICYVVFCLVMHLIGTTHFKHNACACIKWKNCPLVVDPWEILNTHARLAIRDAIRNENREKNTSCQWQNSLINENKQASTPQLSMCVITNHSTYRPRILSMREDSKVAQGTWKTWASEVTLNTCLATWETVNINR